MKNAKLTQFLIALTFLPAVVSAQDVSSAAAAGPAAQAAPAAPSPVDDALARLKSGTDDERRVAAETLGQLRDPKGAPGLIEALGDPSARVRQAAEDALGLMTWRPAADKLSQMLLNDQDPSVRQQAAISLAYILDPKTGPALQAALKDDSMPVRYAALHALGMLRYSPAEKEIAGMLSSDDVTLRRGAIAALGQLGAKDEAGDVSKYLDDKDPYVRIEAIKALGDIGDASAAPGLVKLLAATEPSSVRMEAALSLSKMGMPDGVSTAYEFVKSPDMSLRTKALDVIAQAGDARSLQFLDTIYNEEQDPADKSLVDLSRQRLNARLSAQK